MGRGDDAYAIDIMEGTQMYDDAEARAIKRVQESGLSLRTEVPRLSNGKYYEGRVPADIGSMTPAEIGTYYGLQTAYTDYVESQIVIGNTEVMSAEAKLDLVRAAVRKAKMGTVQEKADASLIDVRYVEANAEYIEAKTYAALMTAVGEAARRDMKFISRIIETKRMELEFGGRGASVGRVPDNERPGADRFRRRESR